MASSLTHPQRSATVHTCRRSTPYSPSSLAPSYVPYFGALPWLYFLSLTFSNSHVDSSSTLQGSPTNVKTRSSKATMILASEPTETCIFSSQNCPWGGQRRRVLAIEGKTPGFKPPDLVWFGLFASCVLEGYECQSSGNSSELLGYLYLRPFTYFPDKPQPRQPSLLKSFNDGVAEWRIRSINTIKNVQESLELD